jgi:iron-sulfur cluster repair protein YtfE (RIC family)
MRRQDVPVQMPKTLRSTGAAAKLRHDHDDFDRRFDELCERARAGDWRALDEAWRAFAIDLETHLAFEEEVLFPAYAQATIERRELVKRLVAEHAAIRQMLEHIGVEIQLHTIRASTVELFTDLMREHAALENIRLYPWARARAID